MLTDWWIPLLFLCLALFGGQLISLLLDTWLKLIDLLLNLLAGLLDLLTFGQLKRAIRWVLNQLGDYFQKQFPNSKVTKTYTARVIVQHLLTPATNDYSSFSEHVLLGKLTVPVATDLATAFFEGDQALIEQVAQHLKPHLEDSYRNANGQVLTTKQVKICQLDDVLEQVTIEGNYLEISQRLYTFTRQVSLEEFLTAYDFGKEVDD